MHNKTIARILLLVALLALMGLACDGSSSGGLPSSSESGTTCSTSFQDRNCDDDDGSNDTVSKPPRLQFYVACGADAPEDADVSNGNTSYVCATVSKINFTGTPGWSNCLCAPTNKTWL